MLSVHCIDRDYVLIWIYSSLLIGCRKALFLHFFMYPRFDWRLYLSVDSLLFLCDTLRENFMGIVIRGRHRRLSSKLFAQDPLDEYSKRSQSR